MGGWQLALKNLILPQFCKRCGVRLHTEENGYYCPHCWESSPRVERPWCPGCARPHPRAVGLMQRANFFCADCRARKESPLAAVSAPALYDGAIGDAIKRLKFGKRVRLARPLGELLRDWAAEECAHRVPDLVVPVPLHRVRRRERGFNQAELLAMETLPALPGAALASALIRVRPTRAQSRLERAARAANVRGAFAVTGPDLTGKTVLLVDDVITTGGTLLECARALRRAGAVRVDALTAAVAAK